MDNYRFRNRRTAIQVFVGLTLLQLGLRGLAILANERDGNTLDIIGDINGPRFWWLLIPESWTIDLVTRFSFWLLLPAGVILLARAFFVGNRPRQNRSIG